MKRLVLLVLAGLFAVSISSTAFAFVINGKLDDWGAVTPGQYGSSNWTPNSGVFYTVEDYQPGTNGGFVGPGWGGQTFDAEAMYVSFDKNNLYYAIVTGFPKDGADTYLPGDIAFNFGDGYKYGIAVPKLYNIDGQQAGALYKANPGDWDLSGYPESDPTKMHDYQQLLALGNLEYNNTYYGSDASGNHWVIEGSIPLSGFGSDWGKCFTMHWTQTCGNDAINLHVCPVPEPMSLSLLGMGLLGLLGLRRKII